MKNLTTHVRGHLETVTDGGRFIPFLRKNFPPNQGISPARRQIGQLTSREIEVLRFLAKGKLNKQTASELCVSIKTIEKHRENITRKLGIRGIVALTHFAIYTGIIQCNPNLAMA